MSDPVIPSNGREEGFFAMKPTRFTVFLRTFLPWQLIRFAVINLKMFTIIHRNHHA
ncbi:MAG: hypothetical protein KGN76_07070 [Acidobacteriota bacterium]|nr:hypothetical protein [Acidobacteriota bacterium]